MPIMDFAEDPYRGRIREDVKTQTFVADKTIIKRVSQARVIYNKLRANHLKRINLYMEIEGLIQGNPPYDTKALFDAGLTHVANFNDMTARAIYERYLQSYSNLIYNAENPVKFVLHTKDPVSHTEDPEAQRWAESLARNWTYAIANYWPSFLTNTASLAAQIIKFGISPVLFPDERDPRWRVVEMSRFFVPDQAQSDLDMITTVCVESEFTIQYLWSMYLEAKDKKFKDETPWNANEIARVLMSLASSPVKDSVLPHDVFELERRYYSGDISFDRMFNDTVRVVSLFQQEYDGKISHYMFHRHLTYQQPVQQEEGDDFLFFQPAQYEKMTEALVLFTASPGEYTIHANRGIGHKMFSLVQAKIMLDCRVVDMASWSSTPLIKSPSLNAKDVEQIRFYPGVPINLGTAEFTQNTLGANIQNVIGASQYLASLINFNLTYSGSDPASPDPDKGSLSPLQTKLMALKEFSILKNAIMHYYATFDRVVQLMAAKMFHSTEATPGYEIAKCWKERCLDDGVPEEIFNTKGTERWQLPKMVEVSATRVAGAGSQVAHLLGLQELQPIMGSFGPREEHEYKKDIITASLGPEYVERYLQDESHVDEMSGGASLAGVENAIMQVGKSPIFSEDNDQRAHMSTHIALAKQTIEQVTQQQMSPVDADKIFGVLVPHLGDHGKALAKNPFAQSFWAQVMPAVEQIFKYAQLNRKNAVAMVQAQQRKQQEMAQEQQRIMNEEQLKNMQVAGEEKRKNLKLMAQSQRQEKAGTAREEALKKRVEGELAIKREQAQGEVAIKKQKAAAEAGVATQEAQANPQEYLQQISGETPSPTDIEGTPSQGELESLSKNASRPMGI